MTTTLIETATTNVRDILKYAIPLASDAKALVVYDDAFGLTRVLTEAYRHALPLARFVRFDAVSKEEVMAAFGEMQQGDLVVLIQSSSFRLDDFRIRLHLFNRGLAVIEHTHLHRNSEDTWPVYVDSLAYDPAWYRVIGPALKAKLESTSTLTITGPGTTLSITGGLETPKLNTGDYTGMENVGGTFPIGEVFTEARDFAQMNGSVMLYGLAGPDFTINMHEPFRVDITAGIVTGWSENTPKNFSDIIARIQENEQPIIRELGFGLNRAITRERYMQDITAYERLLGLHLSIGEKHSVYKKPGISAHKSRYHVDVFPVVSEIRTDDTLIFSNGMYHT